MKTWYNTYTAEIITTTGSRDEKIEFVDRFNNGKFSYLLSLVAKFEQDKETLPKGRFDEVKSTSLKAWIKRNDSCSKHIFSYIQDFTV